MTPAWRNSASTATSGAASAAVCDDAARLPAAVRPLFTATIGFVRATLRASRTNLPRVPERLEVEEDHLGLRVVGPVLQEIVAADVGLVADRDELGDADAEVAGPAHQLDAEPARLRQERDVARDRLRRRERRVHAHRRARCSTRREQFGPMMRMPLPRRERDELALGRLALGPASAKPAVMTSMPRTPFSAHCARDVGNLAARERR